MNRKGVDWASPEMIVIIILSLLLLGAFFYFFIWKKIGGILP
ncbi:MAG: hypothetical protein V2A62_05635 [Candidatus Woesearchaeota archaeon]